MYFICSKKAELLATEEHIVHQIVEKSVPTALALIKQ